MKRILVVLSCFSLVTVSPVILAVEQNSDLMPDACTNSQASGPNENLPIPYFCQVSEINDPVEQSEPRDRKLDRTLNQRVADATTTLITNLLTTTQRTLMFLMLPN